MLTPKASRSVPRLLSKSSRSLQTIELHSVQATRRYAAVANSSAQPRRAPLHLCRHFSTSQPFRGLMPETDNPPPREAEAIDQVSEPTPLTDEEYHELADAFLETLENKIEEMQDQRTDIELEFAAGVLTVTTPIGVYVLNKQPPNKQIWLSSPVSGPKRYDWAVFGESLDHKEGSGRGDWIYLRDGSSLSSLLRQEIGVDLGPGGDMTS